MVVMMVVVVVVSVVVLVLGVVAMTDVRKVYENETAAFSQHRYSKTPTKGPNNKHICDIYIVPEINKQTNKTKKEGGGGWHLKV